VQKPKQGFVWSMFQKQLRERKIHLLVCVTLVFTGLLLVGVFTEDSALGITPFGATVGHVGPNATFAPWWWQDDNSNTGVVEVGAGNIQGMPAVGGNYAGYGPWHLYRDDVTKIVFTDPNNTVGQSNLSSLFRDLPNLTTIENINYVDLSSTNWLSGIFRDTPSLTTITGIEDWDVAGVQRFSAMFRGTTSLKSLDVSSWDVSSAQRFDSMFRDAGLMEIIGLDNWDTSSVTWMMYMFRDTTDITNLDLGSWDTSNTQRFDSMFRDANSLISLDLSSWSLNSATVSGMANMFTGASSLEVLVLGDDWVMLSPSSGLPEVLTNSVFTGVWQNVGSGTIHNPQGVFSYTSPALMVGSTGASNTWVWARSPRTVVFQADANGALDSASTLSHSVTVPTGKTLSEAGISIPIPVPEQGYEFAHWVSLEYPGIIFTSVDLLGWPISQDIHFIAVFEPISIPDVPNTGHEKLGMGAYSVGLVSLFGILTVVALAVRVRMKTANR